MGHLLSWCSYCFWPKCGNSGIGVYTFEGMWHMLVNISIRWKYMYRSTHTFCAHLLLGRNVSAMPSHLKHWVIVPFHKVGTGIDRWKSVNCRQALQGMFCVCSHRHVNGCNWTVPGGRGTMVCERIRWVKGIYGSTMLWIFLQDLQNMQDCCQWVPYHLNVVQQWTCCGTNL